MHSDRRKEILAASAVLTTVTLWTSRKSVKAKRIHDQADPITIIADKLKFP